MLQRKNLDFKEGSTRRQEEAVPENPRALECKRRMLAWPNPVEFVNNMYGCHPKHDDQDYFEVVFGK
jgi:hypothetical protein